MSQKNSEMVIVENSVIIGLNYSSFIILPIPLDSLEFVDKGIQLKKSNGLFSLNSNIKETMSNRFLE